MEPNKDYCKCCSVSGETCRRCVRGDLFFPKFVIKNCDSCEHQNKDVETCKDCFIANGISWINYELKHEIKRDVLRRLTHTMKDYYDDPEYFKNPWDYLTNEQKEEILKKESEMNHNGGIETHDPSHYQKGGMDVWTMEEKVWGTDALIDHCLHSAFEYLARCKDKGQFRADIEKVIINCQKVLALYDKQNES